MAIQRPAPGKRLKFNREILSANNATFTLPVKHKRTISLPVIEPEDSFAIMKHEVGRTILVAIVILVLILLVTAYLR